MFISLLYYSAAADDKPRKIKRKADKAYATGDFYSAKNYYEFYCLKKPDRLRTKHRLAKLQYYTRDHKKACLSYRDLHEKDPEGFPLASYFAARSYHMIGNYNMAMNYYDSFLDGFRSDKIDLKYKKLSKAGIEGCKYAILFQDSLQKVAIVHLDTAVNKAYNEFSPIAIDDQTLWFAGIRSDSMLQQDEKMKKQFYLAKKINNTWMNLGLLDEGFNDPIVSTGNGAMSPAGKRFFFTRCENNVDDKRICSIYMSVNRNGQWQDPEMLPFYVNHKEYTSTQPTIGTYSKNPGKEILYFVSDRPGGMGGFDIWYTLFNKHTYTFTEAKPLGRKINGVGDEHTPYYDNHQRALYFSSDSYPGYGGLDIFKSTGERKTWTEPINMDRPLNSSFDDIYFINLDKERGYFASNRDGGIAFENENCCDDLYSFRWTAFIHYAVEGKVLGLEDEAETSVLANANATLYFVDEELEDDLMMDIVVSDQNGDFLLDIEVGKKYKLIVSKDGYFSKSYEFDTRNIDFSDTLERIFTLQKIPEKPITLSNIYFEFNSDKLTNTAMLNIDTTLLVLLYDNPNLRIRIEAHTDGKGNDDYNLKLSKRRANSIVKYLIQNGIEASGLIARGYGESRPIAPNKNPDGSDNPKGRSKNRRIEFGVIKD
jgi:OmpA-OmpF porin, OOP family